MEDVTLRLNRMGIPVPVIARGINPHAVLRESMFTLCGPVITEEPSLAGNHRLVMLDPTGGMPAFRPLSGYKDMTELTDMLTKLDPGHTWTNSYTPTTDPEPKDAGDAAAAQLTWFQTNEASNPMIKYGEEDAKAMTEDDTNYLWTGDASAWDTALGGGNPIIADMTPGTTDNSADVLTERIDWLFNRMFVVREGSEFAEMALLDAAAEYDALDAAHDTCCRFHKGVITNLLVREMGEGADAITDEAALNGYVYDVKEGECACIYINSNGTKVLIAPFTFGEAGGPLAGYTRIALPSVVINNAKVKTLTDRDGVQHAFVSIDITCC